MKTTGASFIELQATADPRAALKALCEEYGAPNVTVHIDNPENQKQADAQADALSKLEGIQFGMFYGKERDLKSQVQRWATVKPDGTFETANLS